MLRVATSILASVACVAPVLADLQVTYHVRVQALIDNSFSITVDLDEPLPEEWVGKVGFNFELFPGLLFGKSWLLDDAAGHFTQQPNGPIENVDGEYLAEPLATGRRARGYAGLGPFRDKARARSR